MSITLPPDEQAPAWLPTAEIPVQRSAPPVQIVPSAPGRPDGPGRPDSPARRDGPGRPTVAARPDAGVRTRRRPAAAGGLAAGLAVGAAGAIGAVGVVAVAAAAPGPTAAPTSSTPVVSVPGRVLTAFGDGSWQIGVDIAPGTYTASGAAGTDCYRALRTAVTGGDIVSSAVSRGPATVVLTEDGGWFETFGCATWIRTG